MEWYWWVLIAVGVAGLGYLKIQVWNHILDKNKKTKRDAEDE